MDWVSSKQLMIALGATEPGPRWDSPSARTAFRRAHNEILHAKAKLFIKNGENLGECDLPKEFWWAEGDSFYLKRDWVAGDFLTNDPLAGDAWRPWEAFGVEWCKEDAVEMGAVFSRDTNEAPDGLDLADAWLSPFVVVMIETARKERLGPTPEQTPSIECLRESMAEVARAHGLADSFTPSLIRYAATLIRHPDAKEGAAKWKARAKESGRTPII